MAIIKYNLTSEVNGTAPNYITDGGYFLNRADDTMIGIGSGGGTTIASKADLITYVLSIHASYPFKKWADDDHVNQESKTDSELTTDINTWCTARGIS